MSSPPAERSRRPVAPLAPLAPLAAAGWMLLACALFALMNVCAKYASRRVPWHEVAGFRAAFGALVIFGFARARGVSLIVHDRATQWRRTIAGTCAMAFGFFALSRLPMGDSVTLANLTPLLVAIASRRVLDERAGGSLGASAALGFVGVSLVAGAQLHAGRGALVGVAAAVAGATCSAIAMMQLRRLGSSESAEGVSLHFAQWGAVAMFLAGLGRHVLPTPTELTVLALAGLCGGFAQVAMTRAYGLDKAARVGAIGYSGVVMSQALAVVVFGDVPTARQLGGAALVVISGIVLVGGALVEARRGRAAEAVAAQE
jgi:drug/metabolite transporter (DMT)-like permease